ncbi:LysR family transcriptional regulator [Lactobacillus helveticus]|uniref:LysR family transcriptional regulator n=1 Tax=Lactobacillus helveticus TaxID=1587 RepID=UPI0019ECF56B|nr:LysR family transcriptional regulator [Lactobacillus helveticus]NRO37552.1 putative HTH-type transcriptional regulator YahB [Lactobacillus helveticus]
MIENYLLEELVAFAKYGTIAKTAEALGLTQPAVTHSMKKLEDELGVKLFIRLYLSETGKYTAREAKKLINDNLDFIEKVKQFEKDQTTLIIGVNAPGPLLVLRSLKDKNIQIKNTLIENNFKNLLAEHQMTCLLGNFSIEDRDLTSTYLGTESMSINLPAENELGKSKELSFKILVQKPFSVVHRLVFGLKFIMMKFLIIRLFFRIKLKSTAKFFIILSFHFLLLISPFLIHNKKNINYLAIV